MRLVVHIGTVTFPNPVTVASGTFGYIEKYYDLKKISQLGALIPKTVTLDARVGNPSPRIFETASGMINAIGLENQGLDYFIKEKLPTLERLNVPIIVSISGNTDQEFVAMVERLDRCRQVAAIELNLSCPNLGKKKLVAQDPLATGRLIRSVKQHTKKPIIAKLSPNVTDIVDIALAAQTAKADGLSLVNTFSAMAVDIQQRRPVLGNVTGGLSGPAIKPIALKMVYDVARATKIPIVAMGGIANAQDALEFLIAGASMVAVGTVNFVHPNAPVDILRGIKQYMKENKINDIKKLIGTIRL